MSLTHGHENATALSAERRPRRTLRRPRAAPIHRPSLPVGHRRPSDRTETMKPGIHPEYHEVNVIMTDGTQFKTRTCAGKAGDTIRLDIDPKSHPAWTGVQRILDTGGQVAKFNKKFAGLGLKK